MEHAFLKAFLRGQEKGFDYFFREYFRSLTLFAFQLIHDEREAEDIVQNCFEKLWKRRKSLPDIQSIKSYLYTSVRYSCVNFLKAKKITGKALALPEIKDFDSDVESLVVLAETIKELYSIIEMLPPRMRQVFKLYYLEGMSYKQIGELLHTAPGTVRNQRITALELIRKSISTV